ncbi:hypothetical protein FM036_45225, partial [Nostoc sp. HG1]|nr:hypothetical protein [Nostoc sp. HG1]
MRRHPGDRDAETNEHDVGDGDGGPAHALFGEQHADLHCRITVPGKLSNNKGVNFPGVYLSIK